MNKYSKEYIHRINKVTDYIDNNLSGDLSPEKLSDIASFSRFHFHRIFLAFMGETISDFVKRKRLEKAAGLLANEPDRAMADIAYYCGFKSQSVFCRNFKDHFTVSAGEYRLRREAENSNNNQIKSKNPQMDLLQEEYVCDIKQSQKRKLFMNKNVEIKELPAMNVIYCRHTGQYDRIGEAYEKLFRWAGPRSLLDNETKCITYYHDDPKVTDPDKVRQSACIITKSDVRTEGEIGQMKIAGGKHFVAHFEILQEEFQKAWDSTCIWLAESGYQPEDRGPFEIYHNDHEQHPEKKFIVDICIPVKRL
ncbi:MAG TPA: GyrI-like domain-containing protein [Bacteroidales bacterium]|nr:GyrI-like domain-containing protein [Bacteroidales bacterium]